MTDKLNAFILWVAGVLISLNAIAPACAQTSVSATSTNSIRRLTLTDAKRTALERNWDLLASRTGVDLASAQLIVTKEFPNPTASLSTARIGTHENATIEGNSIWHRNYDTIAAVSQLIEVAGKRSHRQAAARAGVLGARARFLDAKRTLDQGVTKAYLAALLAENNVRILNESAGYLQHEAKIAQDRFNAGDISDSDK